jgi:hypothetical protein
MESDAPSFLEAFLDSIPALLVCGVLLSVILLVFIFRYVFIIDIRAFMAYSVWLENLAH